MGRGFFLSVWFLAVIPLLYALWPCNVSADSLRFRSNFQYQSGNTKNTNESTGESIKSEFTEFDQQYIFDASKTVTPFVTLSFGNIFELDKTMNTVEGDKTTIKERLLRPTAAVTLVNPLYRAGLDYRFTERKRDITDIPSTLERRQEWTGTLGWKPVGLPEVFLQYNWINSYDDPETMDETVGTLIVDSDYTWKGLVLDYQYSRIDTEEKVTDFESLEQTHLGSLGYSRDFLNRRLFMNAGYRIRYNTLDFLGGGGTNEVALQRSQGLFSLDNTPDDGPALGVNAALIDGNLIASAGIDIGLGGDQTQLVNIGLDFGVPVDVDQIRVWVDQRLSSSVVNSFSWDVYTSPDNIDTSTWTLVATVSPADFGTFDNRFEIAFDSVNTRFIKVVTRPLSPAVPDAVNFPNIFVTEMQAFITLSGEEIEDITTQRHNLDFGLRAKLSEKTNANYNVSYQLRKQDPTDEKREQLTNTISINHVFNRIFSSGASLIRSDEKVNNGEDSLEYRYAAFLRGTYLPTFNQTLAFSGRNLEEGNDSAYTYSITLRNNAIIYPGWSAFLDSSLAWDQQLASEETERTIRFLTGTNFEPNRKLNVDLTYQFEESLDAGQGGRQELDVSAFYLPFSTLSLNASLSLTKTQGSRTRTFQTYNLNWSPFPDGTFQFFFTYSESRGTGETDTKDRVIGPGLNWTIGRFASLDVQYSIITSETDTQKTDTDRIFAELIIYL